MSDATRRTLPAAATAASTTTGAANPLVPHVAGAVDDPNFRIRNHRVKQSIMGWTFDPMPTEELAGHCKALGMHAMEGVDPRHFRRIRELGLQISLTGSHGFAEGPCDPAYREHCVQKLRAGIDLAVECGAPGVITFTGMRTKGLGDEQMTRNCVETWKRVAAYAEAKQVNLCLEHLNTRDGSHPMKGHPGYFGDDVDHCVAMIEAVGSPRMKLLFDIYHVQVMHGDVIRRIRQYQHVIGHYHTAGVPGRGELDETQELNYPAIVQAIVATGFQGYLAQEFLPTWPDRIAALRHAVRVCDV